MLALRIGAELAVDGKRARIKEYGGIKTFAEALFHLLLERDLQIDLRRKTFADINVGGNLPVQKASGNGGQRGRRFYPPARGNCMECTPYDRIVQDAIGGQVIVAVNEKTRQWMLAVKSVHTALFLALGGEAGEEGLQQTFHGAGGLVKIDVPAQVVARQQKLLGRCKRLVGEAESVFAASLGDPDIVHDPIGVKAARTDTGHVFVPHQIIHSIGIKCARDNGMVHVSRRFRADDVGDFSGIKAFLL